MKIYPTIVNFFLVILSVCLAPLWGNSQQTSQFTMNSWNRYLINPAYAGFDGSLSFTGVYRTQWLGINGNPVNQHMNGHMPLYFLKGAAGFRFDNEYLGAEQNTRISISYNYVFEASYGFLSGAVTLGYLQKKLDGSSLRTPEGIYEGGIIEHQDPVISNRSVSAGTPTLGLAGYFVHQNFEGGISLDQLITSHLKIGPQESDYSLKPILNTYFEYHYVYDDLWSFHPSILLRTDFIQMQSDLGIRVNYNDYLDGGLHLRGYGARSFDAVAISGSIQLSSKLMIGYAYDIAISKLSTISQGSHEVIFNYNLGKIIGAGISPKTIYNPRY